MEYTEEVVDIIGKVLESNGFVKVRKYGVWIDRSWRALYKNDDKGVVVEIKVYESKKSKL